MSWQVEASKSWAVAVRQAVGRTDRQDAVCVSNQNCPSSLQVLQVLCRHKVQVLQLL